MTFWVAATFGLLFLIAPTVMTRLRAEAGVFACYGYAPRAMLSQWLGTRRLGPQNLTSLTVCFFNSEYRPQQMPHQLEGFKISEQANLSHRKMFAAILIATGLGVLVSFWIQLHLYYDHGAASGYFGPWALGHGRRWYGWLKDWIYYPTNTDWLGVVFMGGGFSVMMLLAYLRSRVFWMPLHPLGFLIAGGESCRAISWFRSSCVRWRNGSFSKTEEYKVTAARCHSSWGWYWATSLWAVSGAS